MSKSVVNRSLNTDTIHSFFLTLIGYQLVQLIPD